MLSSSVISSEPIAGYTVVERIGVGGYGEVWRAELPGGLSKALKFVYGYLDDERAARELKALQRIKQVRHPFLLSLERIEVVDGQLIIVTELAEMSLKDRFDQCREAGRTSIPRDELLVYMGDAADALDYMSETFSLQHLDIKPENLLLVGGRVKVADFGLVKDICDPGNASLMGGLTPVYAPPEVFDGRASRASDQYSLAIVYQEMLTGVLPFPGKTAAQLATQHMQSRPRLVPLPPADQPIIARALAKNPDERFQSCRALVDALIQAGKTPAPPRSPAAALGSTSDTTSAKAQAKTTDTSTRPAQQQRSAPVGTDERLKTEVFGSRGAGEPARDAAKAPVAKKARTPRPKVVEELPPLDVAQCAAGIRPTLFIGIGGAAGEILRQFRLRMHDHVGSLSSVPAWSVLLLDTDAAALTAATGQDEHCPLPAGATLAMPLRRPQDYSADSRNLLQWLSRRWLYNIPRSLQTEGLRPLGRLALVDHFEKLLTQLRGSLTQIVDPQVVKATAEHIGLPVRDHTPRVFVVASICGGTGSGMVLDVAHAVRKVLSEMNLSTDGLCGLLTYATDRKSSTRDLSVANAYACLSELGHYADIAPYPGEASCELPAATTPGSPFADTYLVNLGDDLTPAALDSAVSSIAEYLYVNTMTVGGALVDHCRGEARQSDSPYWLRTLGIAQLGLSQSKVPEDAAELLGRRLVERWQGVTQTTSEHKYYTETSPEDAQIDALAAQCAASAGLSIETIVGEVKEAIERTHRDPIDVMLRKMIDLFAARQQAVAALGETSSSTGSVLESLGGFLGSRDKDKSTSGAITVEATIEAHVKQAVARQGGVVANWIFGLVDGARTHAQGAARGAQWMAGHLRTLEEQVTSQLEPITAQVALLEHGLQGSRGGDAPRGGALAAFRRGNKATVDTDQLLLQYGRLRIEELALCAVRKLARGVATHVSAAGDQLKDLRRELNVLADQFVIAGQVVDTDESVVDPLADVRGQIAKSLESRIAELTTELDTTLRDSLLKECGGIRGLFAGEGWSHAQLALTLRDTARTIVLRTLEKIDVVEALLKSGTVGESLKACLDLATPSLLQSGGARRLIALLPTVNQAPAWQALIQSQSQSECTLAVDSASDVVLCYECEQLSLPEVAQQLIGDQQYFASLAGRLHTRVDVAWSPLVEG